MPTQAGSQKISWRTVHTVGLTLENVVSMALVNLQLLLLPDVQKFLRKDSPACTAHGIELLPVALATAMLRDTRQRQLLDQPWFPLDAAPHWSEEQLKSALDAIAPQTHTYFADLVPAHCSFEDIISFQAGALPQLFHGPNRQVTALPNVAHNRVDHLCHAS